MTDAVVELGVGSRVWLDGSLWEIQEIGPRGTTLSDGRSLRSMSMGALARSAAFVDATENVHSDGVPTAVGLASLDPKLRKLVEERAAVVRCVLAAAAQPGFSIRAACAAQSAAADVSPRTLERWVASYRTRGAFGLANRSLINPVAAADPRWHKACLDILDELVPDSTPTMDSVLARVGRRVQETYGVDVVPLPSRASGYRYLAALAKGRHAFGSAKGRRSVAERPTGVYGRLRSTRPGEYVVLDTTPLDVFAMEPVTLRWVPVELTIAMDLFTRCIVGLRLTPVSTKSQDVANVLFQAITPRPTDRQPPGDDGEETWPYHGVPRNLLLDTEVPDGVSQRRVGGLPACVPEAIVVDHGKQYLSEHVIEICDRFGITVQPAIPHKATDKPNVERFFKTLRESLLQHLPAYKGPDVYSRGRDIEGRAFYYVAELEQIIREWVGTVYHHTKHAGLCVPELPQASFSPAEMFEIGTARAGSLTLPARAGLAYEFLNVEWRTIQHYGVEINGQRYNGAGLNFFRNVRSPYTGVHAGKWPFMVDVHDVRYVYFQNPDSKDWHRLDWEHAPGLDTPFSRDAAEYAKRVSVRANRHVDPHASVHQLLQDWSRGEVTTRRDRSLARRLSAERSQVTLATASDVDDREAASTVVDLLARRGAANRSAAALEVVDDVDVFADYYDAHPDSDGFEVFVE